MSPTPSPLTHREHPRTMGWVGASALAMGGSNQSLFLLGALFAGQGAIHGQGSAAIPLLAVGLVLSWMALPGWTELVLMWPNRVGGIAATCGEAFRPYAPVLGNLTGISYWWGWVPTCGLTALLSASAINQWFLPQVPVPALACALVVAFTVVNLVGVQHAGRLAVVIATLSAGLAFLSVIIPLASGQVDWVRASSFTLDTPFPGIFGQVTSAMAGLYLVGFAAPAFEAAACHVGEMKDPEKSVPKAMYASAAMATLYFLVIPAVWLGALGPEAVAGDLAQTLGPVFAPLFGAVGKSAALWFMMFNMFHGTLAPLTGVARTLSQLSEDGLLPEFFAARTKADVPWVAILFTAACAIVFLLIGDPVWLVAAANFTYLIGIALPSVAVWLLRRNQPNHPRPYRAPRGTIGAGLVAAAVWGVSTVLGFQQFGLPTVILGLTLAYSGAGLYAWRRFSDRRRAGLPGVYSSLHVKLTGAMLMVLTLDGVGYVLAVTSVSDQQTPLIAALEDIFVAVAMLTITVGLVLPGTIAHAAVEVAKAADRLATGTLADFSRAMRSLADGDLAAAHARVDLSPVEVQTNDEVGQMAASFNTLQAEVARAAQALDGARDGLQQARRDLTDANQTLEQRVADRTVELEAAHHKLVDAARKAGMAEVAIGVVHNVGNVLNSVNASASVVDRKLRGSRLKNLSKVAALLEERKTELATFLAHDERGRALPSYLTALAQALEAEQGGALHELELLVKHVEHIKQIVNGQHLYANGMEVSLAERVTPSQLMEEALGIGLGASTPPADLEVVRLFAPAPDTMLDKHRVLQILVNLVRNAVRALEGAALRRLTLGTKVDAAGTVSFTVTDSGSGIDPEHLHRIFQQGFTTKPAGRGGSGLHSAALAAQSMGGSIHVASQGLGHGASFTLSLPPASGSVPVAEGKAA